MFPLTLPPFSIAILSRCRRRLTRNRTAPPSRVAPAAPTMTKAAFDSRASPVSRTATACEIGGAESRTTSENALLLSKTSAHQSAFPASRGRTIHSPSPNSAQSRGASVRDASMYAIQSPRPTAASTTCRSSVSLPLAPTTSVSRPRGSPPEARARSNPSTPVGIPSACGNGAGNNARRDATTKADDPLGVLTIDCRTVAAAALMRNPVAGFRPMPEETPKTWGEKTKPSTVIR